MAHLIKQPATQCMQILVNFNMLTIQRFAALPVAGKVNCQLVINCPVIHTVPFPISTILTTVNISLNGGTAER